MRRKKKSLTILGSKKMHVCGDSRPQQVRKYERIPPSRKSGEREPNRLVTKISASLQLSATSRHDGGVDDWVG